MKYIKEFDSIRALAVFMVFVAHWFTDVGLKKVANMHYGVDIFFALSGFLITSILLNKKKKSENKLKSIKNFFIRRVLRLFPIFYLFITLFFLAYHILDLYIWREELGLYLYTYSVNFIFLQKGFYTGSFDHIWSLCVEEQFYLIWPWIVYYLSRKRALAVISSFIILSLFFNTYYFDVAYVKNFPFLNFHILGIGALGAFIDKSEFTIKFNPNYLFSIFIASVLGFVYWLYFSPISPSTKFYVFLRELLLCITTGTLIFSIYIGWPKPFVQLLRNKSVIYLGRISYGLYLYHKPIPYLFSIFMEKTDLLIQNKYLLLFIYLILLL